MEDHTLLAKYVRFGDEAAFAELVRRHAGMVLSTAWHRTGNRVLAEEAAQGAFTLLARRAREGRLPPAARIAGWLHETALHLASRHFRTEQNHRRRVRKYAAAGEAGGALSFADGLADESVFTELLPFLDAALERLSPADRDVLLLRFYENRTLRETGERMGKSESAALRHVNRALAPLGAVLRRQGRLSPATLSTATLTSLLGTHFAETAAGAFSGAALNSLTESALASAAASSGAGVSFWTSAAVFMSKAKTLLAAAAVVLLCLLPPVLLRRQGLELRARLEALNPENTPAARPGGGAQASPLLPNKAAVPAALDPNAPRRYILTQQMLKDSRLSGTNRLVNAGLELSELVQTLLHLTPEETRAANAVILSTVQDCRALQKQLAKVTAQTETEFAMEIPAFPEADQQRLRENLRTGLEETLGPKRAEIVFLGLRDAGNPHIWRFGYFGESAVEMRVVFGGAEVRVGDEETTTYSYDALIIKSKNFGMHLNLTEPQNREAAQHLFQVVEAP